MAAVSSVGLLLAARIVGAIDLPSLPQQWLPEQASSQSAFTEQMPRVAPPPAVALTPDLFMMRAAEIAEAVANGARDYDAPWMPAPGIETSDPEPETPEPKPIGKIETTGQTGTTATDTTTNRVVVPDPHAAALTKRLEQLEIRAQVVADALDGFRAVLREQNLTLRGDMAAHDATQRRSLATATQAIARQDWIEATRSLNAAEAALEALERFLNL